MAEGGRGGLGLRDTLPEDRTAPIPGAPDVMPRGVDSHGTDGMSGSLPGALDERYEVVRVLPGGRQARVLRVRDRATGADLVVKVYDEGAVGGEDVLSRLEDLEPPHVMRPVEVGREGGRLYEVQEYAAGGNLAEVVRRGADEGVVRQVVGQLVEALACLHARGIAHRDLKPTNVLLRQRQSDGLDLALADFGSSALPVSASRGGVVTCAYAPPEAFLSAADPAGQADAPERGGADCWALGMMTAEMLSGEHPLLGTLALDSEERIADYLAAGDLNALVRGVRDARWQELCRGLLARDPWQRWSAVDVRGWLQNADDSAAGPGPPRRQFAFVGQDYATCRDVAAAFAGEWRNAASVCRNQHSYDQLRHWILHDLGARAVADRLPAFDPDARDDVQVFRVVRSLDPDLQSFRGVRLTPASVADLARSAAVEPSGEAGEALRSLDGGRVLAAAGEADASLAAIAEAWAGAGADYVRLRRENPSLPELVDADRTWLLAAATARSGAVDVLRKRVREALRTHRLARQCRWFQQLGGLADAEGPALLAMSYLAAQAHADVAADRQVEAERAAEARRAAIAGATWGAGVGGAAGGLYLAAVLVVIGWTVALAVGCALGVAMRFVATRRLETVARRSFGGTLIAGLAGAGCAGVWLWTVNNSYQYLLAWLPGSISTPLIAGGFVAVGTILGLIGSRPEVRDTLRTDFTWRNGAITSLLLSATVSGGIVATGTLAFPRDGAGFFAAGDDLPSASERPRPDDQLDEKRPAPGDDSSPTVEVVRDCPLCPVLVTVPAGRFRMGSGAGDAESYRNERPAHTVDVARFALGRFEVTRAEYAVFVEATSRVVDEGCLGYDPRDRRRIPAAGASWSVPGFAQDDDHPVVCVSWDDAQAYVRWHSETTGREYRLPSESEWEYAARAGATSPWPWGNDRTEQCRHANGVDRTARQRFPDWRAAACSDGVVATAPVGSFAANRFGLHDMAGNAWEWVADCWHPDYAGAPGDGSAWRQGGDCSQRVLRGGSWADEPAFLRSAGRGRDGTDLRESGVGFRVAMTLD